MAKKSVPPNLISVTEAAHGMQWLQMVGNGDTPDAANAKIVEGLIRALSKICEMYDGGDSTEQGKVPQCRNPRILQQ
jgi:hypothetical protein